MSRGLGKSQRLIIDTLEQRGPFYLAALADGDMGSRYKSLHRAAIRLEDTSRISIVAYRFGQPKLVVCAVGCTADQLIRDQVRQTSERVRTRDVNPYRIRT